MKMIRSKVIGNILLIIYYNKKPYCSLNLILMTLTMKDSFISQHYNINLKVLLISHSYY